MVKVLCYGHNVCKFNSCARFIVNIPGHVVKGLHFDCRSKIRGSIRPCLYTSKIYNSY